MASFPATPKPPDGHAAPPSSKSSGFDGRVHCSSLADLIQLECLSGARQAVSVRSSDQYGYLFFDGGRITHAFTGDLVAEDAVLEMLSWDAGTFDDAHLAWPDRAPVTRNWQELLMRAAQRRDERDREQTPAASGNRLVALPSLRVREIPSKPSSSRLTPTRSAATVLSQPDTSALTAHANTRELVELGAYVRRLAQLIGDDLGLGRFDSLECRWPKKQLLTFVGTDGAPATIELPPQADPAHVRRELGR